VHFKFGAAFTEAGKNLLAAATLADGFAGWACALISTAMEQQMAKAPVKNSRDVIRVVVIALS